MYVDFDTLDATKLYYKDELETLLGVTRVALRSYRIGKTKPGKHTAPRIEAVSEVLADLVSLEKLPFKPAVLADPDRRKVAFGKLQKYVEKRISRN